MKGNNRVIIIIPQNVIINHIPKEEFQEKEERNRTCNFQHNQVVDQ